MPAPLIGVTTYHVVEQPGKAGTVSVGEAYIKAVVHAGGIPLILSSGIRSKDMQNLLSHLDGILFTGGGDVDPERFSGEKHHRVYGIDPRRDEFEIDLVQMAIEARIPFLGICRGIQVINVALGGSLFTHISDQLSGAHRHDCYPDFPRDHLAHSVTVDPESQLAQILGGTSFEVNSLHHQGIHQLASPLKAVAFSTDTLVEAVELNHYPFGLGVQWHPECLQAYTPQQRLFETFVHAAAVE